MAIQIKIITETDFNMLKKSPLICLAFAVTLAVVVRQVPTPLLNLPLPRVLIFLSLLTIMQCQVLIPLIA